MESHSSSAFRLNIPLRLYVTSKNYVNISFLNNKVDQIGLLEKKIQISLKNKVLEGYNNDRYNNHSYTPRDIKLNMLGEIISCKAGELKTFIKNNNLVFLQNTDGVTLLIQPSIPRSFSLLSQKIQNLSKSPLDVKIQLESSSSGNSEKQTRYLIKVFLSIFGYLCFTYVFHYLALLCWESNRAEEQTPDKRPRTLSQEQVDIVARKRVLGDDIGKYNHDL